MRFFCIACFYSLVLKIWTYDPLKFEVQIYLFFKFDLKLVFDINYNLYEKTNHYLDPVLKLPFCKVKNDHILRALV